MIINEIFRSIQGESSYAGMPCIFVRLTGCNLRCSYCDTKYSYIEGKKMTPKQVVDKIKKLYKKGDIIEFTGGEPMLQQKELEDVISLLYLDGCEPIILIETNGSILIPKLEDEWCIFKGVKFIMDWKSISSGMDKFMESANLDRLKRNDELKFVLKTNEDYDEMKRVLKKYNPKCKILISTEWGVDRKEIVKKMLDDGIHARFQIQMHKLIWPINKRGV